MKKNCLFLTFALLSLSVGAQVPYPKFEKQGKGFLDLRKNNVVTVKTRLTHELPSAEAYQLHVTPDSLVVRANTDIGFLRAQQTLESLTTDHRIPVCDIEDYPAYEWRGFMLDVSRHFFSLDFLKRQVDLLSSYKINRLHIHLVDAGGWRLEIKKYPRLTKIAAWRRHSQWDKWWSDGDRNYLSEGEGYGGYYTQDEMRELVAYAKERGMEIIPEIEMPGHSEELLHTYPEIACRHAYDSGDSSLPKSGDVCPGNEGTYEMLENILDEVMDIFPSKYIHIGGDEAGMGAWKDCPLCQQKMKEEGLTEVYGLQTYLINRIGRYLSDHGRQMIGWDEIIDERISGQSTVMVWRNSSYSQKAVAKGCEVIMSPGSHCYFDNDPDAPDTTKNVGMGYLSTEKVYSFDPHDGLQPEQFSYVKGLQANLWTEWVEDEDRCEMLTYPRMLAIAEIGWNGDERQPYADFRQRCLKEVEHLRAAGVNAFDLKNEIGQRSERSQRYRHKAVGKTITYNIPYSKYYPAQGESTLVDGEKGGWLNNDGYWQGFCNGKCLDVTVDLGKVQSISSIAMEFMNITNAWIWLPKTLRYSVSEDGEHFTTLYTHDEPKDDRQGIKYKTMEWKGKQRARYIRVEGEANGEGGWIFTDEIIVK